MHFALGSTFAGLFADVSIYIAQHTLGCAGVLLLHCRLCILGRLSFITRSIGFVRAVVVSSRQWPFEWMRLGIQYPLVKAYNIGFGIQQVEVLERFGEPETLHRVVFVRTGQEDTADGAMAGLGLRRCDDGLEHLPTFLLPGGIARDAVHVPHGFDSFRAIEGQVRSEHRVCQTWNLQELGTYRRI